MPDASSNVEVKIKWVLGSDGVRAIDSATGAVRALIRNEKELADATAKANREMGNRRELGAAGSRGPLVGVDPPGGSPAHERVASAGAREPGRHQPPRSEATTWEHAALTRHRAELDKLTRREADNRRVFGGPPGVGAPPGGPPVVGLPPSGGPPSGGGNELGMAGAAAARFLPAAYAAHAVSRQAVSNYAIQADPYLSARSKNEQMLRNIDVIGGAAGRALDLKRGYTGETERLGYQERATSEALFKQERTNQMNRDGAGLRATEQSAANRAEAFAGFRGPRVTPGLDRGSVSGLRQYEEEARMLPFKRELVKLDRERGAAAKDVRDSLDKEAKLTEKLAGIDKQREAARRASLEAGDASRLGIFGGSTKEAEKAALDDEAKLAKQRKGIEGELRDEKNRGREAKGRVADIDGRYEQARVRSKQEQLAIAQEKEQQAGDKSVSLSRAGIGGRETAKVALEMAKEFGVENLPPELRDSIGAVAPDTLRRMEMEDGDKYKDEFGGLVDKGERGFDRDKAARGRTDKAKEDVAGQEDRADQVSTQAISDSPKGYSDKIMKLISAAIQAETEELRVEQMRGRLSGG